MIRTNKRIANKENGEKEMIKMKMTDKTIVRINDVSTASGIKDCVQQDKDYFIHSLPLELTRISAGPHTPCL